MEKSAHTRAYTRLVDALRRAREKAGLTQAEVAFKLRTYASFVSKVESAERRLDVIELLSFCELYGIELQQLLREARLVR